MNYRRSKRQGYDGWALLMPETQRPLGWSLCTTREECRDLIRARPSLDRIEPRVVKVRLQLQVVE